MEENDRIKERSKIFSSPKFFTECQKFQRMIVVLENCQLECGKIGKLYKLLNADDHRTFLKKHSKIPSLYRPDILHSCLLSLFDSPLNKSGLLEVFIRSTQNQIIKINPLCRIPRTFNRFSGLFAQLLNRKIIKSGDGKMVLMKMIKGPITNYIPPSCTIVKMTPKGKLINLFNYVPSLLLSTKNNNNTKKSVCFVVGAFAKGHLDNVNYCKENVSISKYGLSASVVCSKLCNVLEQFWEIL